MRRGRFDMLHRARQCVEVTGAREDHVFTRAVETGATLEFVAQ